MLDWVILEVPEEHATVRVRSIGRHGKPIVFLHGFGGSGDDWLPVISKLGGERRLLVIDAPGHGSCPVPANSEQGWSIEQFGRVVCSVLEQLDEAIVDICAFSGGAAVALSLLKLAPGRVSNSDWNFNCTIYSTQNEPMFCDSNCSIRSISSHKHPA